MLLFKEDVLKHTDSELPAELEHNNAAKAYYGIALENYKRLFSEQPVKEMALATTKAFNEIIRKAVVVDNAILVDWQSKSDIIGRMKIDMEDELIDNIKRKYGLEFSFDDMDVIIDGCVDVAKIWLK
jgi:type I restriction enzyme R subunit